MRFIAILAACALTPALAQAAPAAVRIDNFTFNPPTITVKAGTTVTWTNGDDVPHALLADDHTSFRSKVLDTGQSFAFTFAKPGEFAYFCSLHPHMTGKVVVVAGEGGSSATGR